MPNLLSYALYLDAKEGTPTAEMAECYDLPIDRSRSVWSQRGFVLIGRSTILSLQTICRLPELGGQDGGALKRRSAPSRNVGQVLGNAELECGVPH